MAHGHFISQGGKDALTHGTLAFVNELMQRQHKAVGGGGSRGSTLAGTGVAVLVAATVILTAVGIGLAGIMKARAE